MAKRIHAGAASAAGDRRPPDEHRDGTCGAADHDVLRAAGLEPDRVHEHVEQHGAHREHRREQVDGRPEQRERQRLEHQPEHERALGLDVAVGERTVGGAAHQLVAVALDPTVDGVGATRGEGAAEQHLHDQAHRRHLARGQDHGRQRGDEQQLDDARFGEVEVGEGGGARPAGPARGAGDLGGGRGHERRMAPGNNLGGLAHSGESSRSGEAGSKPVAAVSGTVTSGSWPPAPPRAPTIRSSRFA